MARLILCVLAILLIANTAKAQNSVGVNTDAPNPNAALDIHPVGGQVQGLLIPRISSGERTGMSLNDDDNGLMVFDYDEGSLYIWYTGAWLPVAIEGSGTVVSTDGFTIVGDGDSTPLSVNVGVGPDQIVQLDASGFLPAVDGSNLFNLNTGGVSTDGGLTILGDGDAVNLAVNVGTGPDQIVQLDASGLLPAVDGSQLTNLPNATVSVDGLTIFGDGDGSPLYANVGVGPDQIVALDGSGLMPAVDGSQLTNIIATNVTNVSSETAANVAAATAESMDIGIVSHPLITDNQPHLSATLQVGTAVDDLNTLTGVSAGLTDLGTFTHGIITNNTNMLTAFQDLENAVNSAGANTGSGITVTGSNVNLGGSMSQNADITVNGFELSVIRGSPSNAATMHLYNNNGSVGTGGNVVFEARNSATNPAIIGKIETRITSTTSGAESGELVLSVATSGSLTEGLRIDDTGAVNANSYNYIGTATRYYGISPVDFSLVNESAADDNELGANQGNSVYVNSAVEQSGAQIAAPVHLPDGAEIVSVEAFGRNTTSINATVHFMAKSYSTAVSFDDQVIVPTGTSGITGFNVALGGTRIIDNNTNNYFIYIDIPTSSGPIADFTGVRITYTVTHAD